MVGVVGQELPAVAQERVERELELQLVVNQSARLPAALRQSIGQSHPVAGAEADVVQALKRVDAGVGQVHGADVAPMLVGRSQLRVGSHKERPGAPASLRGLMGPVEQRAHHAPPARFGPRHDGVDVEHVERPPAGAEPERDELERRVEAAPGVDAGREVGIVDASEVVDQEGLGVGEDLLPEAGDVGRAARTADAV